MPVDQASTASAHFRRKKYYATSQKVRPANERFLFVTYIIQTNYETFRVSFGITLQVIGLSSLIGAFQVGLLIPRTSTLSAALSEKFEYFTVVILMPLFFTNR